MPMTHVNYLRMCCGCEQRQPPKGYRLIDGRWYCPTCALKKLGPPRCRFCGGEIKPDHPRVRMSDRKIAHRECYFEACEDEGV